jgi:DnaA family protein
MAVAQLPLPLRPPAAGDFESFVAAGNTEVITALRRWAACAGGGRILLHGETGCGKSHLLRAACRAAREGGASVAFVALDMGTLGPAVLDGLEARDAVVIDAVQAVAAEPAWELALFNLYNGLQQSGGRLLLAARAPAAGLGLALPDLTSRLCACATYAVRPLDDAGRARLLRDRAAARGMRLDAATLDYILKHSQRDTAALLSLLDALDRTSLDRGRKPNRALVRELLRELLRERRCGGCARPSGGDPAG